MASRCLPKLRRAFPVSHQLVYDYPHSLVVSFGMTERGHEAIVALAVAPRGVRLFFDKTLPDPTGLLAGSGAKVRSVTLGAASDLDRADIRALMKAAIRRAGATVLSARATCVVFKSDAKKVKPRSPRRSRNT